MSGLGWVFASFFLNWDLEDLDELWDFLNASGGVIDSWCIKVYWSFKIKVSLNQNKLLKKFTLFFILALTITSCKEENSLANMDLSNDFCSKIHKGQSKSIQDELAELPEFKEGKTGAYVLEDGSGSMLLRAWLTQAAVKTIDIQYFIFSTDNIGLIACDYLVRAADRGVKVRILVDDILIDADFDDLLVLNSHENISLKVYNPGVNLGKSLLGKIKKLATDFRSANQRMHNKTFIVDDQLVITGGRNIADEYFDYDHEYNFRDRDIFLIGDPQKQVQTSFAQFWESDLSVDVANLVDELPERVNDPNKFAPLHEYACNPYNFWPEIRSSIENLPLAFEKIKTSNKITWLDSIEFVSDLPGKNEETKGLGGGGVSTSRLIELVQNAQESIDIQSPYLITSDLSRDLFAEAIKRGVKVRILTNSMASTDNLEAFAGYQSDRNKLLETGVRIFEFKPDAKVRKELMTGILHQNLEHVPIFGLHAKSMVIDGKTSVIGTFNLDPRSANLNTECMVIVHSEKISQGVLRGMEIEFRKENAWETTKDFNPDSEVNRTKRIKVWTRKIVPKGIL